ncbi:MAG: NAD(P)/FAD-dependent oxidoreductase [Thermocrispum sp.]
MTAEQVVVIVGASLTGASAAQTLREEDFGGRIVLVGAEPERPYERPPLSKGFILGETKRDKLYVHDETWYTTNSVDLVLGRSVAQVDRAAHDIVLEDGEKLGYTTLLLATGASPRHLDVPGGELDGVHHLRRIRDAQRLATDLARGGRIVIVGGGWIGLETAAAARAHKCQVTVVEPQSLPPHGALGRQMGAFFADLHRRHSVDIRLERTVAEFRGSGHVTTVLLDDGTEISPDTVVGGVGAQPNTDLAVAAG